MRTPKSWVGSMRNPLNSWEKSDSANICLLRQDGCPNCVNHMCDPIIGYNDMDLMKRLRNAGTDHRKFMRMLTVYVDITAPLYWWKEFDTYKVGTVANSCSTMHTIHKKEFGIPDFSLDHLINDWYDLDYCDCVITSEPDSAGQGPSYYLDPWSLFEMLICFGIDKNLKYHNQNIGETFNINPIETSLFEQIELYNNTKKIIDDLASKEPSLLNFCYNILTLIYKYYFPSVPNYDYKDLAKSIFSYMYNTLRGEKINNDEITSLIIKILQ